LGKWSSQSKTVYYWAALAVVYSDVSLIASAMAEFS
jgi:hypothetical protein